MIDAKPIRVLVTSIGEVAGSMTHRLSAWNEFHGADKFESLAIDPVLRCLSIAEHLKGYDSTATTWVGLGFASGGKLMLDAAE